MHDDNIDLAYERALKTLNDGYAAFHKVGAVAIDPGLETTIELARRLGDPQNSYSTVHVAGTNGKGSVAHTLAAILQKAGYRVGLYTSPHILDFRERIRVDGKMIPKCDVVEFMQRFERVEHGFHPSFFEVCTLMAFWYFAKSEVDIAVVEVGLGGRLDSTNIIVPKLSVVTNISLDHTQLLGETEPLIAAEKAGIFKHGVPAVVGEAEGEVRDVFIRKAASAGAPLTFACDSGEITKVETTENGLQRYLTRRNGEIESQLTGECQSHNALTVLESVNKLRESGLDISSEAVRSGFSQVCDLTGLMAERFRTFKSDKRLVIGFVSDKDVSTVLSFLRGIPRLHVYACQPSVDRALPAEQLADNVDEAGLQLASVDGSVMKAYANALTDSSQSDMLFIGGSTFVVADFLEAWFRDISND